MSTMLPSRSRSGPNESPISSRGRPSTPSSNHRPSTPSSNHRPSTPSSNHRPSTPGGTRRSSVGTPSTPRSRSNGGGPFKSEPNSPPSAAAQNARPRLSFDRSPRSADSKPVVERRVPKIGTPPDKQPRREAELQARLESAQEDLKKAKDQLAFIVGERDRLVGELNEAKRVADETHEKLQDALMAKRWAEEATEIEKFRADELEQAGIDEAQRREEEWQREIECVRGQHAADLLFSSTQIDHNTGKGRLSAEAPLRGGKKTKHGPGKTSTMTYQVTLFVDTEFGTPGAIVVKNGLKNDQFFLRYVQLELAEDRSIHFECNSWVYPYKKTNSDRVFFINTSYLPEKTPDALRLLREEELRSLRGNGRGERKDWERIYDYNYYNDLGNPDKEDHIRPVLGGTATYPYPRRCRTGRALFKKDGMTETRKHMINLDFYIPPDERFNPTKLAEVLTLAVQAVTHFVIPESKALFQGNINNFKSFDQLRRDLYSKPQQPVVEGVVMDKLKTTVPSQKTYKQVSRMVKETPVRFPIPQVIEHDQEAWRTDEEFAREMLAGLNPVVIKRLNVFPPVSSGGKKSSITPARIEGQLEGRTVEKAIEQNRLYILDHHDYLMPYLRRINTLGVCIYASRTLLFLKDDGTLKPVVIELSLPSDGAGDDDISRIFLPASQGMDGHLWQLAKAHVSVNDSGYHQLISHWLFTHATVEPFIIATKRQLSAMHPINKLLEPHFKDNMQINTLARSILLSAGGILERTMYPGKYAMEMSSAIYSEWRFTEQSLPNELIKRGMASKDPSGGVTLHIEDYPYAVDGLDVWRAIEGWVQSYCAHFYHSDAAVVGDKELQAWWDDVRLVGHGDRQHDPACWLKLDTVAHLVETLSTLIWIASALHAAVNFGQYGYAGFMPNRPTRCRRFVPLPGSPEMLQLEADPEKFFLEMVPDRFTTTLGLALIEVLSNHTSDELYLGQRATSSWTDDGEVLQLLDRFREELRRVEKQVAERNRDPRLKNRRGPAKVPYTLLFPDVGNVGGKEKGITGKGIPNSVSI